MKGIVVRKFLMAVAVTLTGISAFALTEVVDGIEWTYTKSGSSATVTGVAQCTGNIVVPAVLGGCTVVAIGNGALGSRDMSSVVLPSTLQNIGADAFIYCYNLEKIDLPDSLNSIGHSAFQNCTKLKEISLPKGVTWLSYNTFMNCHSLEEVNFPETFEAFRDIDFWGLFQECYHARLNFYGQVPYNVNNKWSNISDVSSIRWTRTYGNMWLKSGMLYKFGGFVEDARSNNVEIISSSIRESDPTVMDVVYRVTSTKPTVKVRALAFEDGDRSFIKVVIPETFIEGTEANIGDAITPNVEHTLSWKVSSDWSTRLAKVKFEVLAMDNAYFFPLVTRTIPASDTYGKMMITWNAITGDQWFDALLWLYADKTEGLTLANGVLRNGSTTVASGASASTPNACAYVYSKMGYSLLTGAPLTYANKETRLGLSPSGTRQYAYKIVED